MMRDATEGKPSPIDATGPRAPDSPTSKRGLVARAAIWLAAIRPRTLPAAVSPVAVGTAFAIADGQAHLPAAAAALCSALLLQIGTNLANDYSDFRSGADDAGRIGPPRVTQRGWMSPTAVVALAATAFAAAALAGVYLVLRGGWPILAVGLAAIACGLAYTGRPIRYGYRGFGDIVVWIFFGPVAVGGTYYVQARALPLRVAYASVGIGALITAILVVNNIRDRHGDRAAGKHTLAVKLGLRASRWEYTLLLAAAYVLLLFPPMLDARQAGWLLPWVSAPLALREIRRVRQRDGAALNASLGSTAQLGLIYSALLAVGVCL